MNAVASDDLGGADAVEIVETLIGHSPERYGSPLAALHGWGELYNKFKGRALVGDDVAMGVWLLIADIAQRTVDAGTKEAFATDMVPVYRADPDRFLAALARAPWLSPTACRFLGNYFGSEDRPIEGRATFIAAEAKRIKSALPGRAAGRCLDLIAEPDLPNKH